MSAGDIVTTSTSASVPKGRRRRRLADEGEESTDVDLPMRPSECESEGEGPDLGSELSESAVETTDQEEETEGDSDTETETGSETESGSETETEGGGDYTDEEGLDQERQSGDGEEQPVNDKPDDDEDKKNPAYVPRRGTFYEHDFRQGDEGLDEEVAEPGQEPAKPGKKLWQEDSKWSHDRFIDELQAPKTREELIAIYGYDIRAADKPPEAPPRRPDGDGSGRGRRERNMRDFMPRMAVIDTTEGGTDSVPNLGDEDLTLYNSSSNRGGSRGRGGRRGGGPRGGGGGNRGSRNSGGYIDSYKEDRDKIFYTDQSEAIGSGGKRFDEGPRSDNRNFEGQRSRPGGNRGMVEDFPSLQDSANHRGPDGGQQRSSGYNSLRKDPNSGDEKWDRKEERLDDSQRSGRGGRRSEEFGRRGSGRISDGGDSRGNFTHNQDARRDTDNWRGEQRTFNSQDTRGHFDNRSGYSYQGRGEQNSRGDRNENWRNSNDNHRNNYNSRSGDSGRKDQRYGGSGTSSNYNNSRVGSAGDFASPTVPPVKYNDRYEQPPRYQKEQQRNQQQQIKEFTNSFMKDAAAAVEARQASLPPRMQQKDVRPANSGDVGVSKNVVVSSNLDKGQREKVQTINVTITSTTTEKKSYAKERRAKGGSILPDPNITGGNVAAEPSSTAPAMMPPNSSQHQQVQQRGVNPESAPGKRYSTQRPHAITGRNFTEPPPASSMVEGAGTKLYNPALPPPPFYPRDQAGVANPSVPPPPPPSHHHRQHSKQQAPPQLPPGVPPDQSRFTPTMLTAASVPMQYPLPAPNPALALAAPVSTPIMAPAVSVNPAIFQQGAPLPTLQTQGSGPPHTPPTPQAPAVVAAPPFLAAGMLFGNTQQVPAAAPPPPFPVPLTYTSPPPPTAQQGVVGPAQPQSAGSQTQPLKPYRGDITYYAPELQQPNRTPQKRPKAAIPIIDPQVIREQRKQERQSSQLQPIDKSSSPNLRDYNQSPSKIDVSTMASRVQVEHVSKDLNTEFDSPVTSEKGPDEVITAVTKVDSVSEVQVKQEISKHSVDDLDSLPPSVSVALPTQPKTEPVPLVTYENVSATSSSAVGSNDYLSDSSPSKTADVKQNNNSTIGESVPKTESSDVSTGANRSVVSDSYEETKTNICIVAVDSRPPLTIIQSEPARNDDTASSVEERIDVSSADGAHVATSLPPTKDIVGVVADRISKIDVKDEEVSLPLTAATNVSEESETLS